MAKLFVIVALMALVALAYSQAIIITVSYGGSQGTIYTVNGTSNSNLTLDAGTLYQFNINLGGRNFCIKTAVSAGTSADLYAGSGLSANCQGGTTQVTFTPDVSDPDTLYWVNPANTAASGMITIVKPPTSATAPTSGTTMAPAPSSSVVVPPVPTPVDMPTSGVVVVPTSADVPTSATVVVPTSADVPTSGVVVVPTSVDTPTSGVVVVPTSADVPTSGVVVVPTSAVPVVAPAGPAPAVPVSPVTMVPTSDVASSVASPVVATPSVNANATTPSTTNANSTSVATPTTKAPSNLTKISPAKTPTKTPAKTPTPTGAASIDAFTPLAFAVVALVAKFFF
jgi:hypothetical protein